MTYWNPVDHYGADAFARDLASAGGAGLITPDLTPEEAQPWLEASDAHDLDRVFLVAPSSPPQRVEAITRLCRGFVYAVSLMGITGARDAVSSSAAGVVARIREHTNLPAAVGLGVSTGAQARRGGRVRRRRDRRLRLRPPPRPGRHPGRGGRRRPRPHRRPGARASAAANSNKRRSRSAPRRAHNSRTCAGRCADCGAGPHASPSIHAVMPLTQPAAQ